MSWWFPQLNRRGDIISGNGTIWLNGQDLSVPTAGHSPQWTGDGVTVLIGDEARIVNTQTGASSSLGFTFSPRAGNTSGISAGAWHWCGWTPQDGLNYDGTVVDPLAAPGAIDQETGALYYLTPYQTNVRRVILNGSVVRANVLATEIMAGDACATWGEYEGARTLYGWSLATGVMRLSPLDATEHLFTGIPVRTSDGLWLVTQTHKGVVVYPWGGSDGYIFEGDYLYHHAMWLNGVIAIVATGPQGQLVRTDVDLSEPRTDLRAYHPTTGSQPVVITPINRPLWLGFFTGSPNATGGWNTNDDPPGTSVPPGNAQLNVPTGLFRASDGRIVGAFIAGSSVEEIETRAAGSSHTPICYWDARRWPRLPNLPAGSWLCVQGYRRKDESVADFEADLRAILFQHVFERPSLRHVIVAQCYSSNASLTADLPSVVAAVSRLAASISHVYAVIPFSGNGRQTGLQDHPDVRPLWQEFAASIPSAPPIEDPMRKPEVTVDRWTLDELLNGREFVFHDRENLDLGYSARVFIKNGSMHAEIHNRIGKGETGATRTVKTCPEAPPEPPIEPEPTDELICRAIWREELLREIDPSGLQSCMTALANGQSPASIREGVRQSDEWKQVHENLGKIHGRLRIDGRMFVDDLGFYRPVWTSGLSLLKPGARVVPFLDWAVQNRFNGVRVFAGKLPWAGQTPQDAIDNLPRFLEETKSRGLRVEVTALTETASGYDKREHVRRIVEILTSFNHAILELANEPHHATQDSQVHDPNYLKSLKDELVPGEILCALGCGENDESLDMAGGDYVPQHLDRGRDKWNMVRRVRELEVGSADSGKPEMNNEPIGADEVSRQGARESDPAIFFTMGILNRIFEVGGIHHSQHGLDGTLPGPNQQECATQFIRGARLMDSVPERYTFKNAGWSDSPVKSAAFEQTIVRAYSGVIGNEGVLCMLGLSGDPRIEMQNGWAMGDTLAELPGVKVVRLHR